MPRIANRVIPFGTTIFTEMNTLAQQHQAINLGQGRPDFDGAPQVIDAFAEALHSGRYNQYAPGQGALNLRQGVANHAARAYGLEVDIQRGVLITPGATEAIFAALMGLVDTGDEVIVIEPFFDSYVPGILMAGATPVYVALHPPTWTFDADELRAAFSPKTRAIILNTPHNPTGRVFTRLELALIAELCIEFDVTVISDEVYEHLIFDEAEHIAIASLPGMFERTVTVGSAGKTFGMTGWKIGWIYGHPDLLRGVGQAHQYIAFAANHPAQEAVAFAFTLPSSYYEEYRALYTVKRDLMMAGLNHAGLKALTPEGTYFVMADFSEVFDGDDLAFAHYLPKDVGVACIPPRFFYSEAHQAITRHYVRLAFCKGDETLRAASERLAKLKR
ncbi:MAG: aminotransferase class I/II-fold pyridoxal phosphate-dependent enzyme [Anaerolineae bacterium]|jgi:N-succinyldiaminopimelate aminotransferase|nr:aminotransferase class I/II-fold pyridoxal phosphate-dependent enzyme [Anaerolineae bacterium]